MSTLLQPGTTAPKPGASAPSNPLAGQTVLDAEGQTGQKGIQLTPARAQAHPHRHGEGEHHSRRRWPPRGHSPGGGCSGLSYNIRFDTQPRERDRVYAFPQTHLDATATDAPPIRIFVDPKSFIYLHGMVLDYEETLMRQGFNFINPHSTKSCGCGSSFST